MIGLGTTKKKTSVVPSETESVASSPLLSWLQGEATPVPAPRKKKTKLDAGGQLLRGSMRAA